MFENELSPVQKYGRRISLLHCLADRFRSVLICTFILVFSVTPGEGFQIQPKFLVSTSMIHVDSKPLLVPARISWQFQARKRFCRLIERRSEGIKCEMVNPGVEPSQAEMNHASNHTTGNKFMQFVSKTLNSSRVLPQNAPLWMDKLCQIGICALFYAFHVFVLCANTCTFPFSLSKDATETVVTWETIFGTAMFGTFLLLSGRQGRASVWTALFGDSIVARDTLPGTPPTAGVSEGTTGSSTPSQAADVRAAAAAERRELPQTFLLLGLAYLASGYMGQLIELVLCFLASLGAPLTMGMYRALQVLLAHLFWVVAGSLILQARTSGAFFARGGGPWFRIDPSANLLWGVAGGYWLTSYVSCAAIHINGILAGLPGVGLISDLFRRLPESATEAVIDQLRSYVPPPLLAFILPNAPHRPTTHTNRSHSSLPCLLPPVSRCSSSLPPQRKPPQMIPLQSHPRHCRPPPSLRPTRRSQTRRRAVFRSLARSLSRPPPPSCSCSL
jgi:hypothetical protein